MRADVQDSAPGGGAGGGAAVGRCRSGGGRAAAGKTRRVSAPRGTTTVVELTRTQQTIARRMAESKATIPDFSIRTDVDMEKCVKLR